MFKTAKSANMAANNVRKKIHILCGHPANTSLSSTLVQAYSSAAEKSGHEVRITYLNELDFDPDFEFSNFSSVKPLEADLERFLENLEWCEHFVLIAPMWWGGLPAKLKGLIDRAFLPGKTFDTRTTTKMGLPAPMLTGRTARVVITSDTPNWFQKWIYGNPLSNQIKGQILGFIGLKPVRITQLAAASNPKDGQVQLWQTQLTKMGAKAA